MTATRNPLSAEQMVSLRDEALALPALLAGTLNAKIDECKKAMADLNDAKSVAGTVREAQTLLAEAKAKADKIVAEAEARASGIVSAAEATSTTAERKLTEAVAREGVLAKREAELVSAKAAADAKQSEALAAVEAANKELASLAESRKKLETAKAQLDADRKKLNDRLEALKLA